METTGGILYALRMQGTRFVKVGFTRRRLLNRIQALQSGLPFHLEVIAQVEVDRDAPAIEKRIHGLLAPDKVRGEWFECDMDSASFDLLVAQARALLLRPSLPSQDSLPRKPDFSLFASRLYLARRRAGLRQAELAHLAKLYPTHIRKMEAGRLLPTMPRLRRLAAALGVPACDLLGML